MSKRHWVDRSHPVQNAYRCLTLTTPKRSQESNGKEIGSDRHHADCRFGGFGFCCRFSGRRRAARSTVTCLGLRFSSSCFPAACRAVLPPWPFAGLTLASRRAGGSRWVIDEVEARGWLRGEIAAREIFGGTVPGVVQVESGRWLHEKLVIIAVLITAAEVDDITMIGIRNNAVSLCILIQFLVASPCVVHQSQDLMPVAFHLVLVNARHCRELREV